MIKKMMRHGVSFSVIGILLLTQGISAAEVQLKRFKAGDVIYAEDVNGNFQALADTVKQMQTLIAELQKQNAALLEKNRTLEANLSTLQAEIMLLKKQQYRLRSTPKIVPEADVQQVFGLDRNRRPLQYIVNDFEQKGDIVIDYATGRTWQQSGSPKELTYQAAQQYVQQLNQNHFAGYSDWRLPTVSELLSLMTEKPQTNKLYINPVFDPTQRWCWSVDTGSSESAWFVNFFVGGANWLSLGSTDYVRCVRSIGGRDD